VKGEIMGDQKQKDESIGISPQMDEEKKPGVPS
jgi:hypothetical protein